MASRRVFPESLEMEFLYNDAAGEKPAEDCTKWYVAMCSMSVR